jgi:hypothetical protein
VAVACSAAEPVAAAEAVPAAAVKTKNGFPLTIAPLGPYGGNVGLRCGPAIFKWSAETIGRDHHRAGGGRSESVAPQPNSPCRAIGATTTQTHRGTRVAR